MQGELIAGFQSPVSYFPITTVVKGFQKSVVHAVLLPANLEQPAVHIFIACVSEADRVLLTVHSIVCSIARFQLNKVVGCFFARERRLPTQ